ncbi:MULTISPECIES: hypothetical protein [Alteromonadaceae]|uniref:hypothetical protein n=1 Tax=Alteromonadaceae TaxID=72275 RepID=UPI001C086015|nr:hypothetical protein [Aliiglaciecola lipolytica]MBU2877843.1 hypothetical protein [Aliiglaciecola lipolytica]
MKIHINPIKGLVIIVCIYLSGCASNKDSQLHIRHVFDKQITPSSAGFEFVMTWFLPPAELFGSQQNSVFANMGLRSRNSQVPRLSLDNETRLRLEDIAIQRLENELESNRMCPHGYKIDQIKWLERSIGFIGKCQ